MITVISKDVKIDLDLIDRLELTPDEYIFLYCWYHSLKIPRVQCSVKHLEEKGYLKILEGSNIALRAPAINLFEHKSEDKCWFEFFGLFPMKVPGRNGTTRPLRPASLEAKACITTKKKYLQLIKNKPELHKQIIKVLEAELEMRKQAGTLQYMHNIDTWLNQNDYEIYSYLIDEKNERTAKGNTSYGQTLV